LLGFIGQVVEQGFMGDWQTALVTVGQEPEDLLRGLVEAAGFTPAAHLDRV
jgi:hypothetical protein